MIRAIEAIRFIIFISESIRFLPFSILRVIQLPISTAIRSKLAVLPQIILSMKCGEINMGLEKSGGSPLGRLGEYRRAASRNDDRKLCYLPWRGAITADSSERNRWQSELIRLPDKRNMVRGKLNLGLTFTGQMIRYQITTVRSGTIVLGTLFLRLLSTGRSFRFPRRIFAAGCRHLTFSRGSTTLLALHFTEGRAGADMNTGIYFSTYAIGGGSCSKGDLYCKGSKKEEPGTGLEDSTLHYRE